MLSALLPTLGGGALSALLYLSVLTGGGGALILAYLAPLPLFLVGLSLGPSAGVVAGAAGAVVVAAVTADLFAPVVFAATGVVPVVLVVRQALLSRTAADGSLEWYPPGLLIMWLTGLGIAAFLAATAVGAVAAPGGLYGVVQAFLTVMLGEFFAGQDGPPDLDPARIAATLASVFPAVVVVSWLMMTIINGVLAQGLLMRFQRNRRPPMRMGDLELPGWAPLAFAAAGLGALVLPGLPGFVAQNVAIILALPFFFAGLAVVHVFAATRRAGVPLLLATYLVVVIFVWSVLLVVGLGAIEQWIGLRRRLTATGPNQEDK